MINVTKSFLPPIDDYIAYLRKIWETEHLTNHGPLVYELEQKIKNYLGVKHFFFINNGTVALQIAIKALGLKGEIVTTPFSYVATTSSIAWENIKPVFADIRPEDFTIDPDKIQQVVTPRTSAILATHVYGIPCDIAAIEEIADKNKLKVIYDAAHAFGVKHGGTSILNFGDISTLSFHATKLFHTVEGGGIVTNNDELAHRISYMRNFGHKGQEEFWGLGINGKNSEFHAAMGLCVLPNIDSILKKRKTLYDLYNKNLDEVSAFIKRPAIAHNVQYNYAYYPTLLESEKVLLKVKDSLNASFIYPRRYFYPSLEQLPYVDSSIMPQSDEISRRVLCLPLYPSLQVEDIDRICFIIKQVLKY